MLKFFRTIRKKLIEEDNVRKYLLYAIGEILLVVIGILIALQVNNWNELRKDNEREQVYLHLLHQNLSTDLIVLKMNKQFYKEVLENGTRVLSYLRNEEVVEYTHWELLVSAFHASQIWSILLENSTYEELKSTGDLSLLQNASIRNRLGFYYGGGMTRYLETMGINPPYRKMSRMVIPYHILGYMWDECHETVNDEQILKKCEPNVSEEEAIEVLYKLINDEVMMGELGFFMSAIRSGSEPLNEQIRLCETLLAEIERSLVKI
tara:strand:+ start:23707 stop:24498 length:792 start_codon:yes stop_codon:yes gene_type:complete